MISKIVGNIFYVIFITIIMLGLVGAIIASGIWLETSGELIIIALIVAFVIAFAVLLVLVVMTIKQLFEDCSDIDKMLNEVKNAEDKD
jgi:hypothetical protein